MQRFLDSLVAVIEANQRHVLLGALRQLGLLIAAGVGLSQLAGWWWWLCLLGFGLLVLGAVSISLSLVAQFRVKLEPPWRAVGLQASYGPAAVLELHSMKGVVTVLAVPTRLQAEVVAAAREGGVELVTGAEALKALNETSARLERLADIEALIPHVPTPELRAAIEAAVARVREVAPVGCDEVLRELEVLLMAEESAQTTTSLRGPKPVYEKEIREKLVSLRD